MTHTSKLYNLRFVEEEPSMVNIMRGTFWGNQFVIGKDGDRATVIAKHKWWLAGQEAMLRHLDHLKDYDLLCCCKPLDCHGDIYIELLPLTIEQRLEWARRYREENKEPK